MSAKIDYKENLKVAMDSLKAIEDDTKNLNIEISQLDIAEQDILHIIENLNFNASQGYALSKRLKDIRAERREIKHKLELAKEMRAVLDVYRDRLKDRGEKALKNAENIEKTKNKRKYVIRTLTDLEPFNQLANKQRGLK